MRWLGAGAQGRDEQVKVEEDWPFGSKTFCAARVPEAESAQQKTSCWRRKASSAP